MSLLTRSTAKALSVSPTEDSTLLRNGRGVTPDVSRTPLRNTPVKLRTRRASLGDTPQNVVSSPLRRSRRLSTNFDETTTRTKLRNFRTIRTNLKLIEDPVAEEDELKKVTSPHELTSAQNNSTESFANENRNLALQSKDETLNASGKQFKQSMSPAKKKKIESGKNGNGKANISPMIVKKTKLVLKKVATEEHQSPGRLSKDGPKEVSLKTKNEKSEDELDNDEKLNNSKEVTPKMQSTKTFVKESSKSSSPIAIREKNVNRNKAGMYEISEQRAIDIVDNDKGINGKEQLSPVAENVSDKYEVKAMIMINRNNLKVTVMNEKDVPCDDPEEELRSGTSKGVYCKIEDTIEDSGKIDKMQLAENEASLPLFAKDADSVVALNIDESSIKVTSALVTDSDSLKSNLIKQAHIPKESDLKYGEFAIETEVLIENNAEIEPQQSKNAMIVTPPTLEHPSLASKPATPIPEPVSPKVAIENTTKTHTSKTTSQFDQNEKNEVVFSTSCNQSIKVTVNSSLDSPEFIDAISFKNRNSDQHPPYSPQNISSKKMLLKSVPRSSDSEDDDEEEYISRNSDGEDNDEDHNEFFDDEAMEAPDDAESLNSSERAYLYIADSSSDEDDANEIPEKGESIISSEDTSEDDSEDETDRDDDEDKMNSFIASKSEIEKSSANGSLMGTENEIAKKKICSRTFVVDDEDEMNSFIASESEIEKSSANDSLMGSENEVARKKIRRRTFVVDKTSDEDANEIPEKGENIHSEDTSEYDSERETERDDDGDGMNSCISSESSDKNIFRKTPERPKKSYRNRKPVNARNFTIILNKADLMLSKSFTNFQKSKAKSSIAISRRYGDNTLVADAGTSNLMIPKAKNMKKLPRPLEERKGRAGLIPLLDDLTNGNVDKIIATAKKKTHRSKDNESLMETVSKFVSKSLENITENVPKSNENNLEPERTRVELIPQCRLSDNATLLSNENSYEKRSTADPISSRKQSKIDEIATNESSSSEPQDELTIASASNKSNSRSFKSLKRAHQSTNHEKVKINDKANAFILNDQSDKMEQTKGKSKEKSIDDNTRLTISNKTMKLLSSSKNKQQTSKNISELEHSPSASNNSYENYLRGTQSSKKSKNVSGDNSGGNKKKKFRLESEILKEIILNRIEEAKQKGKLAENVQKRNANIPNSNQLLSTYVPCNIQQNKKKRKLSVNEDQPIPDKKKKTNQRKETSSPHNKDKVVKIMNPKTSRANKSTYRSEDTSSDESKDSNGWQVSDISKKKWNKKLKILNEIQFGFQELPATPNKVNGFKVEPVTPKNIGWKVSSILSADQKEAPELSKKPKKSRPATHF